MLTVGDQENVTKSSQSAQVLVRNIQTLLGTKNYLLGNIAQDMLPQAVELERRLSLLELNVCTEKAAA